MPFHLFSALPAVRSATLLAATFALSSPVHAEFTLNAGARLSHDNNVNGSPDTPTKANQRSDTFLTLNASAVYFTALDAAQTSYFIGQVGAVNTTYNKFSNLNNSMLVGSVGLYQQLSPNWSGQITARGFTRETRQSDRNADGYGGTLEIKYQMTPTLWVKAVGDYEDSKANLRTFSYTGDTYGLNLGYLPLKDTFVNVGYSHTTRDFKSAVPFVSKTDSLFAQVSQRVAKNWYLNAGYAYGRNDSNFAGTAYTNHVISVGLSFSY